MAFDEVRFPTEIAYGSKGGPEFSTDVVVMASGAEQRNQNWTYARYRFYPLEDIKSPTQVAEILAFFNARRGRARGFRFKDWSDYATTDINTKIGDYTDVKQIVIGTPDTQAAPSSAPTATLATGAARIVSGAISASAGTDRFYSTAVTFTTFATGDVISVLGFTGGGVANNGIHSVNSVGVSASSTTWLYAGAAVSVDRDSKQSWQNASRASGPPNATSYTDESHLSEWDDGSGRYRYGDWLRCTKFGFSVPTDAEITGIEVQIAKWEIVEDAHRDSALYLRTTTGQKGSNYANTSSLYPLRWPGGVEPWTAYGGATALWGTTWTPAEINSTSFGIDFSTQNVIYDTFSVFVDAVKIKVYYRAEHYIGVNSPLTNSVGSAVTISAWNGGNLSTGNYYYKLTYLTESGETTGSATSNMVSITTPASFAKVNVTGVAVGGDRVTARKLYRTEADGATFKLVTTISNNTATTYLDNIADANLTTTIPSVNASGRTTFQLAKHYTSGGMTYTRHITKPVAGSVAIYKNATLFTGSYSVSSTNGLVTFASSPAAEDLLQATFEFDVPVRFVKDQLSISVDEWQNLSIDDVELVEIRI